MQRNSPDKVDGGGFEVDTLCKGTHLTGLMEVGVRVRLILCTKSMMKSPNDIPISTNRTWKLIEKSEQKCTVYELYELNNFVLKQL